MAYVSEFTHFMRDWLTAHPKELEVRQQGYRLWWKQPAPALGLARRAQRTAENADEKAFFVDTTQR